MDVREAIDKRRAYRSLEPVTITEELIRDLAGTAQLAPSCYSNQPWGAVFVYEPEMLKELHTTLSKGNVCLIRERQPHLSYYGQPSLGSWHIRSQAIGRMMSRRYLRFLMK